MPPECAAAAPAVDATDAAPAVAIEAAPDAPVPTPPAPAVEPADELGSTQVAPAEASAEGPTAPASAAPKAKSWIERKNDELEAYLSKPSPPPRPTYLDKGYDGPSKAELGWRGRAIHRARYCRRRFTSGARAAFSVAPRQRSPRSHAPSPPLAATARAQRIMFDDLLAERIDGGVVDLMRPPRRLREENRALRRHRD